MSARRAACGGSSPPEPRLSFFTSDVILELETPIVVTATPWGDRRTFRAKSWRRRKKGKARSVMSSHERLIGMHPQDAAYRSWPSRVHELHPRLAGTFQKDHFAPDRSPNWGWHHSGWSGRPG